jgi:hypothetical protein
VTELCTLAEMQQQHPKALRIEPASADHFKVKPNAPLTEYERGLVLKWLHHIRETDKKQIQFVLHHCETDERMRDFVFEEAWHFYESEGEDKS